MKKLFFLGLFSILIITHSSSLKACNMLVFDAEEDNNNNPSPTMIVIDSIVELADSFLDFTGFVSHFVSQSVMSITPPLAHENRYMAEEAEKRGGGFWHYLGVFCEIKGPGFEEGEEEEAS